MWNSAGGVGIPNEEDVRFVSMLSTSQWSKAESLEAVKAEPRMETKEHRCGRRISILMRVCKIDQLGCGGETLVANACSRLWNTYAADVSAVVYTEIEKRP